MSHTARPGMPGALKAPPILFLLIIVAGQAWARDQFDGTKCGADLASSLVGKRSSDEPVATIEARHQQLGLKNLGGREISDNLSLESWQICGSEYELLVNTKTNLIRDVLPFPSHSAAAPMFIGRCQAGGKETAQLVAVLNNSAGKDARDSKSAKTMLNATAAWSIDERNERFVKQSTEGLACPLDGVVTADGGP